ncbi:MAG: MBL fold metallo-hydrolase [Phycisphaeraceae bacterium]|nr:MBL fold metallo-hydrolase [Phycisphaeraceae bacterium]
MDVRIISIGALGAHPLWNEREPVRTGHATTTLIRTQGHTILVDPGLPEQALIARLRERSGLKPSDITHVFLTSFHPECRRALPAFTSAKWWIGEIERETVGVPLAKALAEMHGREDPERIEDLRLEVAMLRRCEVAPDRLAPGVDLYPMPGVSPGLCGLLLSSASTTTILCGDSIPTIEHLEQGKILPWAENLDQAGETFREAVETANTLILGRDNIVTNPTKRPF